MVIIRDPADASRIANPHIRAILDLRLQQLGTFHDGLLLVVEAGDSVEQLEEVSGVAILHDPFSDVPFGHPDYSPSFDYIEAHYANGNITCFEAHADTGDAGLGTTLFISAEDGVDANLLALCAQYAVPATGLMES
ncbi:MAG: hypothetical protein D4R84_13500 [Rhodocyclaceae bacterium]|nr:MAG: hypothetical protein D4R84_13500 [Rhodocyclaceae bacterium]